MTMVYEVAIPQSLYRVVTELTHQPQVETALAVAVKEWVNLRLQQVATERGVFEQKWGMDYAEFKRRWLNGLIANRYSYAVEKDYFDWEAVVTDEEYLLEMSQTLS